MNGAAKIHPYLRQSWPRRRTELLAQQAERLITFELVNERTVEDHYDDAHGSEPGAQPTQATSDAVLALRSRSRT